MKWERNAAGFPPTQRWVRVFSGNYPEAFLGFSASTRQLSDVTLVDVRGRFTLIEGEAVHDLLVDLFHEGRKRVVLNFRDVTYLDSSGIGQLVRAIYTARRSNAELRAVELSPQAAEILKLTNLHTVISDYATESAAIGSFTEQ